MVWHFYFNDISLYSYMYYTAIYFFLKDIYVTAGDNKEK